MLERLFTAALPLFALGAPLSIALSSAVLWPLLTLWVLGARWTFPLARPVWGPTEKAFTLFVALGLISALAGVDVPRSLRILMKKDGHFLIVPLVVTWLRTAPERERYARWYWTGTLAAAFWGVFTFWVGINQTDCRAGQFLVLPPEIAHWPRPILNTLSLVNGRAVGLRCHPLTYAESLLMGFSLGLGLLAVCSKKRMLRPLLGCWLALSALVFSGSRGPWIAAGAMGAALLLWERSFSILVRLALVSLPACVLFGQPDLLARAASILDQNHASNSERLHMWRAGFQLWKQRPLLGVGPGNVKRVAAPYENAEELVGGPWGHLHNTFINVAVERGTLGLAALLLFLGTLGWELLRALRLAEAGTQRRALLLAGLLGLIGSMVSGFTETIYNDEALLFAFYGLMGLALAAARHERT